MKYGGKKFVKIRIPRASHGRFNPYVFTFDLETGTVCILKISIVNVSLVSVGHYVIIRQFLA